jgi:Zn-dependent metalloprotease
MKGQTIMGKYIGQPQIRYILPPHILTAIAQNGTPAQRAMALRTLGQDTTMRILRATQSVVTMGRLVRTRATLDQAIQRTIYHAHNQMSLPGEVIRTEGSTPIGDINADEAYDHLGWTHAFYLQILGRHSIDDEGLPLDAIVHYGQSYNNAFWNGEFMVFGDGDGELFNRFTVALEVVGHELTHGVIEDEAHLAYTGQAGALNESLADVFGSLVKQYSLKQTADQADWLIGKGLFTDRVHAQALRSMLQPGTAYDDPVLGKDPQPDHMNKYVHTMEDNGGVHINSGIPNHAFCKAAIKIGGYAWERAGRIWYETLRDPRLRRNANFQSFALRTLSNAERIYGYDSREWQAVREAWEAVGISLPVSAREERHAFAGAR